MPGDNVTLIVDLGKPVAIEVGSHFAIREGGKTVGIWGRYGDSWLKYSPAAFIAAGDFAQVRQWQSGMAWTPTRRVGRPRMPVRLRPGHW